MELAEPVEVMVVYARPECQRIIAVRVAAGTSVTDAIRQSGILQEFPEIELRQAKLGIFSRRVDAKATVQAGDRIEIYRPLIADPKTVRRERARNRTR